MAAICPQCGNPLDQDFGVATCSQCAAVLFVDLDGNANLSDASQVAEANSEPQDNQEEPQFESILNEPAPDQFRPEEPSFDAPIVEVAEEFSPAEVPDSEPVIEYRDTDQAQGPMSYSVIVGKIDTKEIRIQVLDAINDPKFGWDPREVMKGIRDGVLHLNDLNPVKASVLVQKLKDLPVEINWTQNVYR
jgi:uncharacterized Zn finger protein (UPF0148 family)